MNYDQISNHPIFQEILRAIRIQENVNLRGFARPLDDNGRIRFWPDQALFWKGAFDFLDYIILCVSVAAFSNINVFYFWATVLTVGLNFFILLGRAVLMWEYNLGKFDGKLSVESTYFNALAPVDSVYGNKLCGLIVAVCGIAVCTTGIIFQVLIYKDFFTLAHLPWDPSSSSLHLDPIFNVFVMNFLNLFCAFFSLIFYFKLIGCVKMEKSNNALKSLFFYQQLENNDESTNGNTNDGANTNNNGIKFYNPNKLELVMILLDKEHLNQFARESSKNGVYLSLEFNINRISGI
ncbi:hypothetical protein ACTA71_008318 [Dictyostelium dimigraforme]